MPFAWQPLDISNPPSASGVYGWLDPVSGQWLYIGQSSNIKKRLAQHKPLRIALSLSCPIQFFWQPVANPRATEKALWKQCSPEWNGGYWIEAYDNPTELQAPCCHLHGWVRDEQVEAAVGAIGF